MPSVTYYTQECPTCGRGLQIRVEYLGKKVACRHCAAKFRASDRSSANLENPEASLSLLARADELIDSLARCQVNPSSKC
jgi:hypothetical protein